MFLGRFYHQIDEKGRIRIPPKFKEQLGDEPYITSGTNGSLLVYSQKDFYEKFLSKLTDLAIEDVEEQRLARIFASNAVEGKEDKQGRILLPQHLINHAAIGKNLITIGVVDHAEIWSEENWNAYNNAEGSGLDDVIAKLAAKKKKE